MGKLAGVPEGIFIPLDEFRCTHAAIAMVCEAGAAEIYLILSQHTPEEALDAIQVGFNVLLREVNPKGKSSTLFAWVGETENYVIVSPVLAMNRAHAVLGRTSAVLTEMGNIKRIFTSILSTPEELEQFEAYYGFKRWKKK